MCPDHELLSAWADGEVPSPWRETIERHVRGCDDCSRAAASIDGTRALFFADVDSIGTSADAAKRRVTARLEAGVPLSSKGGSALWIRRFSIPLPVAAAAALTLALLGFALAESGRRNAELRVAVRRAIEATPVATSGMGIESVIDFLSKQNSAININITLPAEAFGAGAGEPFIVREADYLPGSRR